MRAVAVGLLMASMWLAAPHRAAAYSIQESILRVKPAVVLITTEVRADVTLNCGRGPVTVSPAPFVETGTGWFVDGRGFIITNAHVVDPAYRLPAWVTHELASFADRHCRGRIVSCLEGGYNLFHLARSAAEHVRALTGL